MILSRITGMTSSRSRRNSSRRRCRKSLIDIISRSGLSSPLALAGLSLISHDRHTIQEDIQRPVQAIALKQNKKYKYEDDNEGSVCGEPATAAAAKSRVCAICEIKTAEIWYRCPEGLGERKSPRGKIHMMCGPCSFRWRHCTPLSLSSLCAIADFATIDGVQYAPDEDEPKLIMKPGLRSELFHSLARMQLTDSMIRETGARSRFRRRLGKLPLLDFHWLDADVSAQMNGSVSSLSAVVKSPTPEPELPPVVVREPTPPPPTPPPVKKIVVSQKPSVPSSPRPDTFLTFPIDSCLLCKRLEPKTILAQCQNCSLSAHSGQSLISTRASVVI